MNRAFDRVQRSLSGEEPSRLLEDGGAGTLETTFELAQGSADLLEYVREAVLKLNASGKCSYVEAFASHVCYLLAFDSATHIWAMNLSSCQLFSRGATSVATGTGRSSPYSSMKSCVRNRLSDPERAAAM